MKVAITGANGFAGQNLTQYLQPYDSIKLIKVMRTIDPQQGNQVTLSSFINEAPLYDAIVHLAGKAHDLKNTAEEEAYFEVNYELTRKLFEQFLVSSANIFIYISSVKAIADLPSGALTESTSPAPATPYGRSKLKAENYLIDTVLPPGKKVYVLRPCMIHGPGNKGNLNLLAGIVKKGIPYPLGSFNNKRSFLSIENFCFTIREILFGNIQPGVYNLSDDEVLSTNELISLMGEVFAKPGKIWKINTKIIYLLAKLGDLLRLPLNSENLQKLTTNYMVSNQKIKAALNKPFPLTAREGLIHTLKSFI
ncbi:NAD-dependent epimerase/dehydratase family protein [Chitinophaga solisilvae]|uniref:NAD-dependent epimerase/dehydratase family protein n=1 Tax=Chitinophaga solisilvae TaxID=1233460 RepID=UPI00136F052F|nr:NAD-dependent epimerase/dehydratase family protein [Chitinophaga solisilvae]